MKLNPVVWGQPELEATVNLFRLISSTVMDTAAVQLLKLRNQAHYQADAWDAVKRCSVDLNKMTKWVFSLEVFPLRHNLQGRWCTTCWHRASRSSGFPSCCLDRWARVKFYTAPPASLSASFLMAELPLCSLKLQAVVQEQSRRAQGAERWIRCDATSPGDGHDTKQVWWECLSNTGIMWDATQTETCVKVHFRPPHLDRHQRASSVCRVASTTNTIQQTKQKWQQAAQMQSKLDIKSIVMQD